MQRVVDESSIKVGRADESAVADAVVDGSSSRGTPTCSAKTSGRKGGMGANVIEHEFLGIIQNPDEVASIDDAKVLLEISKSGKLDPVSREWLDRESNLWKAAATPTEASSRSVLRRLFSMEFYKNIFDESGAAQYFKSFAVLYSFSILITVLMAVCHLVVLDCWYSMEDYGEDMEGTYGKQDDVEVMIPRDVRYFWRRYSAEALIAVSIIQMVEEAGHIWSSTYVYLEVLKLDFKKEYLFPMGSFWILIWLNRASFISGFYNVALSLTKQQAAVLYEFFVGAIYVVGLHFFYIVYFWKAQARENIFGADKVFSRKLLCYYGIFFGAHMTLWQCWVEVDPEAGPILTFIWLMIVTGAIVTTVWNYTFDRDGDRKRESTLAFVDSTGKDENGQDEDDRRQFVSNSSRIEAPGTLDLRFALKCNYLACKKQIIRLHVFEEGQYEMNFVMALYVSVMFAITYYLSAAFAYVAPSSKSLRIPVWHMGGIFIESLVYFLAARASGGSDAFAAASAFFAQLFFSVCGVYMIFLLGVFSFEYFFAVALVMTIELYRDTFLHRHKHRFVVWCWSCFCGPVRRGEVQKGKSDTSVQSEERAISCGIKDKRGDGFITSEGGGIASSVTKRSSTSHKLRNHGLLFSLDDSALSIYQRFMRDVKTDLVNCAFYWNMQSILVEIFSAVTVLALVIVEYVWMRNEMLERGPYYLAGLDIYTDYSKSNCQDSNSASCHGVNKLGPNSEHQFVLKLVGLAVYLILDFVQGCAAARINTRHLQHLFEDWSKAEQQKNKNAKAMKASSSSSTNTNSSSIVEKDASSSSSSSNDMSGVSEQQFSEEQEEILMSSVNYFCAGRMVTDLGYDHFMRYKIYLMLQVMGAVAVSVGFTRVFRDPVIYV